MWLVNFLKNSFFLPNAVSWFINKIPAVVDHNVGKYLAIKKAFYLTGLEQLEGDYLEFGVFTGSSFVCALRAHRSLRYLGASKTEFYGFDSFSGFGTVTGDDEHPFYQDSTFSVNEHKVVRNITRKAKGLPVHIVSGYFEDTLSGTTATSVGVQKARVVLIDCDLKEPAALCLDFIAPVLQLGTVLVMDDFFSYKGDESKGVAGAFLEFCKKHPTIAWRHIYDYGYGGVGYIVSSL
jgi:O-methyltransferase